MSNLTYVCARCGALRRRSTVYLDREGAPTTPLPICDGENMLGFAKGYAEAASKLSRARRVEWLAAGGLIMRRPGRKWKAAFTAREIAEAREQLRRHVES
jgi:hypothetical protein